MIRLCVICEGQTEAEFVRDVLEPHLRGYGLYVYPSKLKTKPGKQGGGHVTIPRIAQHVRHEYTNFDCITTLVDFYGFSGRGDRTIDQLEQAILDACLQERADADRRRIIPYVQRHEFEALLFAEIREFQWVLEAKQDEFQIELKKIINAFPTPEDINDNETTAPSKRLANIFGSLYSKTEHGPIIAQEIGLDVIKSKCPRFNQWLSTLEQFGRTQ